MPTTSPLTAPAFAPLSWSSWTATGADRVTLLQTKLTCDTRRWAANGGSRGFLIDINGRLIADGLYRPTGDLVRVYSPTAQIGGAIEHLDRYVILEDARFDAESAPRVCLWVHAPEPGSLHRLLELPAAAVADRTLAENARGVRVTPFEPWPDGCWLVDVPASEASAVTTTLTAAGWAAWTAEQLAAAHIIAGVPEVGVDVLPGEHIPLEAGLWNGVQFNKGCYLGQEVIERLHSRGRPSRRLVQLTWQAGVAPQPETDVLLGERVVGGVVRATVAGDGAPVAFAWVRRAALETLGDVTVAGLGSPSSWVVVGGDEPES